MAQRPSSVFNVDLRTTFDSVAKVIYLTMRPIHQMKLQSTEDVTKVAAAFVELKKKAENIDNEAAQLFFKAVTNVEMLRFVHDCYKTVPQLRQMASLDEIAFGAVDVDSWETLKSDVPSSHKLWGPVANLVSATNSKNVEGVIDSYVAIHGIMQLSLEGRGNKPFGEVFAAALTFLLSNFVPTVLADTLKTLLLAYMTAEEKPSDHHQSLIRQASQPILADNVQDMRHLEVEPQVKYVCCAIN